MAAGKGRARERRASSGWGAFAIASLAALAGCASVGTRPGWTAHSTQLAEHRVDYELPSGGIALEPPLAEKNLALTKHEKVSLFAQLGYGPGGEDAPPPTLLSLGIGRIPGGPQPATPSVERLGELVLAEARATHQSIRYDAALERVGKQTWFRLANHVPDSEGVQPEAVIYYQPLDASFYLFVWGYWDASVRATLQDAEDRRRVLAQVVERCRITR